METQEFRFRTREEYEREAKRMIDEMGKPTKGKAVTVSLKAYDAYDDLMEEYVKFLDDGE